MKILDVIGYNVQSIILKLHSENLKDSISPVLSARKRLKFTRKQRGFTLKRSHLAREIVEIVVLALLIFLVIRFVVQSYHVDGVSMQPGLTSNQYVMVNKVAYLFHAPERGDVVVFHNQHPPNMDQDYIKRVIGLPGDTIRTDHDHIWVNDTQLDEHTYISIAVNPSGSTWKVPANQYFVLGDNRPESDDSRYNVGFVPREAIVGKAVIVFWPFNAFHTIDTHTDVYKQIKPGK